MNIFFDFPKEYKTQICNQEIKKNFVEKTGFTCFQLICYLLFRRTLSHILFSDLLR